MKYRQEIEIDCPRDRVVELFLDRDNQIKWQPDLVSLEVVSGDSSHAGSVTRQVHTMGGREVESVETIMVHEAPDRLAALYDSEGVWNLIDNRFTEVGGRTRWVMESDCRCASVLQQIMVSLFAGFMKRQSEKFMSSFKAFAEAAG